MVIIIFLTKVGKNQTCSKKPMGELRARANILKAVHKNFLIAQIFLRSLPTSWAFCPPPILWLQKDENAMKWAFFRKSAHAPPYNKLSWSSTIRVLSLSRHHRECVTVFLVTGSTCETPALPVPPPTLLTPLIKGFAKVPLSAPLPFRFALADFSLGRVDK